MIFSTDKSHFATPKEPNAEMTDQDPLILSSMNNLSAFSDLIASFQSKRVISNAYIMGMILLPLSSVQFHKEAETDT